MQRLSLILLIFSQTVLFGQSPHGEIKLECSECHISESWNILRDTLLFDHNQTDFTLEGQHEFTACVDCHEDLVFTDTPNDCINCHTDVHFQTVGNDCMRCHSTSSWIVDHIPELHEMNGFPLIGAHSVLNCIECHNTETNLRFEPIGNECIICHQNDYMAATNPNHLEAGYSENCEECHDPLGFGWSGEGILHDFFPLVQGHDIGDCFECHDQDTYSGLSPECVECHLEDYNSTNDPDHVEQNFSTDCAACHTIGGWTPAFIDHSFFPLTLGHDIQNCSECHLTDNFSDTSPECVSCHEEDYQNTNDPNHEAANFPTDCAACHNTGGWEPAQFDHDSQFFPIYTGEHENEWDECSDCHLNPNDYSEFSCTVCHLEGETTEEHIEEDVTGYIYESNACLDCHPNGSE